MTVVSNIKGAYRFISRPVKDSWVGRKVSDKSHQIAMSHYYSIQGGNPNRPFSVGLGDGPKDLSDVVPQLARWEEGGVEVAADHIPIMEKHPSYNFSRIGWAARQAVQWYPHAIADVALYVLPLVYWSATLLGINFVPLICTVSLFILMGTALFSTVYSYIGSHKEMGDTFTGDLVSKESLLTCCGPGWVEGSGKAMARAGTPFEITPSGGAKNRLAGRTAFGLVWRLTTSALAATAGAAFIAHNLTFPFLSGADYAMTILGWSANTVFPALKGGLLTYGIHTHHGFHEDGQFKSGFHYLWDEVMHPFTGAK